jgi:hypothetical protein
VCTWVVNILPLYQETESSKLDTETGYYQVVQDSFQFLSESDYTTTTSILHLTITQHLDAYIYSAEKPLKIVHIW